MSADREGLSRHQRRGSGRAGPKPVWEKSDRQLPIELFVPGPRNQANILSEDGDSSVETAFRDHAPVQGRNLSRLDRLMGLPDDDGRALVRCDNRPRGQRREDLEREYLGVYHPIDERVPRVRQLPDSRLVHVHDLYTAEELKTSPIYNEMFVRARCQDSLNVHLDASDGSHITWCRGDPVDSDAWGASKITLLQALLPDLVAWIIPKDALSSCFSTQGIT